MGIGVDLSEIRELKRGQVRLWQIRTEDAIRKRWLTRHVGLLSADENRRHGRFIFQKDRDQFLIARILLRSTLSRYLNVEPKDWRFQQNEFGKPEIKPGRRPLPLRFNISHCNGLILCGVTVDCEIGVDCENIRRAIAIERLAPRVLSVDEQEVLASVPASKRIETFFRFWTLKESYIKARGLGMTLPLQDVSFDFDVEERLRVCFGLRVHDRPQAWQFFAPNLDSPFLAAVAISLPNDEPVDLELCDAAI